MFGSAVTLLFETINFIILAAALWWLFTKPMRKLLDGEIAAREKSQKQTVDERAAVERMQNELAARLAAAQKEAAEIRAGAEAAARKQTAALLEEARTRANEERRRFIEDLELRRYAEVGAMSAELAAVASRFVLDVFARAGAAADAVLARAAAADLSKMLAKGSDHVVIESARPLTDEMREALRAPLGSALDEARQRVVPELVAGVRVASNGGLVDASARGLAATVARELSPGGPDGAV